MAASTTYIHPSVSSTITDNSTTYLTADGTSKLFAVFISERGEDNTIQMITSVSEYEFKYGEPNIKLYGQTGYNIINWLNSGGVVYCLRVLPEDAGYANAIVNIQTKVSNKTVLNIDGEPVQIKDVSLRPVISYTNVNNISKSSLKFNELRKANDKTIDGYTNHMLFAVIPKGRGKGYNDLGFRLTLVDSLDTTYDFRLYNFEVTKQSTNGAVSTIQGPFVVSLDPDAMSLSGESMFIETVIEKYCDYFQVIFNEDNYEELGKVVNPNVNPNRIDFFNGQTRLLENDEPETFYCEETGQEEDVHIYITKYDINNQPTSERNIVDPSDIVESAIINVDNSYRRNNYLNYVHALDKMKEAYSVLRKKITGVSNPLKVNKIDPAKADLEAMITDIDYTDYLIATSNPGDIIGGGESMIDEGDVDDDNTDGSNQPTVTSDTVKTIPEFIDFANAVKEFKGVLAETQSEEATVTTAYNRANSTYKLLKAKIETVVDAMYVLFDYCRVDGESSESISILTQLDEIDGEIYSLENYLIRFSSLIQDINELSAVKDDVLIENNNIEKEEFLSKYITDISEIYHKVNVNDVDSEHIADNFLVKVKENLDYIAEQYEIITDENTITADYNEAMDLAYDKLDETSDLIKSAINYVLLEIENVRVKDIVDDIVKVYSELVTHSDNISTKAGNGEYSSKEGLNTINTNITLFKNKLTTALQGTYSSVLQDFNSVVSLLFGTDGSIEDALPTNSAVISLIAKGYRGLIDDTLIDKNKYPIDVILDANYDISIKNAIITLTTDIRKDFIAILDTKTQATPEAAINYRKSSLGVSDFRVSIFTQDFIVTDATYTGYKMQVTPTYFLSSKIPKNDNDNGIHWNFVGPRRGVISGFESISFIPNDEWKEQLYKAQVNYVEQDLKSTRFGYQLTSQTRISALSNINNVRALLKMQRDIEDMMKDYQFEYNDSITRSDAQTELNNYLNQWITNRCCLSIAGSVYASEYDIQQRIMRVRVEMVFNNIIERVIINLVVNN